MDEKTESIISAILGIAVVLFFCLVIIGLTLQQSCTVQSIDVTIYKTWMEISNKETIYLFSDGLHTYTITRSDYGVIEDGGTYTAVYRVCGNSSRFLRFER